jgi:peroxiredoxin Q/BCP
VLKPGDIAPDFSLPDSTGRHRSLESLLGEKGLILFFYPGDFTPVCTRQACMVRDVHAETDGAGCAVAGISADRPASHARFEAKYSLGYVLLADESRQVIKDYGVTGPFGIGVRRTSYLLDRQRVIVEAVRSDFRVGPHRRLLEKCR